MRRTAQTWAPYCVNYLVIFYTISLSHSSGVVNTVFRFVSFRTHITFHNIIETIFVNGVWGIYFGFINFTVLNMWRETMGYHAINLLNVRQACSIFGEKCGKLFSVM